MINRKEIIIKNKPNDIKNILAKKIFLKTIKINHIIKTKILKIKIFNQKYFKINNNIIPYYQL